MALLPEVFDVHPADVADCHIRTPVPKLHRYADHHFTAINGLAGGVDDRLYFVPLKAFQHCGLVVTVLGPTSTALPEHAARTELAAVQERLDADGFRPTTSLEVITAIRRAMMATLETLIGEAAARIADFEKRCSTTDPVKSERLLDELFAIPHDLQTIRTSAAQAYQSYTGLLESSAEDNLLPTSHSTGVSGVVRSGWRRIGRSPARRECPRTALSIRGARGRQGRSSHRSA
jgi:magnesium transporter